MKVRNSLLDFKDKIIYQDTDYFSMSLDSLLLANFVTVNLRDKVIVDFCTGNAPIPMLLTYKTKAKLYGIEYQKEICDLGIESIIENGMNEQITIYNDDVKNCLQYFRRESVDIITVNPPYFKLDDSSFVNDNEIKKIARHEVLISLEDIIYNASLLLKKGGTFAMVHRPDRLIEIIMLMKKYHIEPKRMRFVIPKMGENANILLIEGKMNGSSGLKVLPELITYDKDNNYTKEIKDMFGSETHVAK